jgi:hypothetical protein
VKIPQLAEEYQHAVAMLQSLQSRGLTELINPSLSLEVRFLYLSLTICLC